MQEMHFKVKLSLGSRSLDLKVMPSVQVVLSPPTPKLCYAL